MKHPMLAPACVNVLLLAFLAALALGCGRWSADYRKMRHMGEKLRQQVENYANEGNINGAQNLAVASCLFAREMDCVAGGAIDTGTDESTWKNRAAVMDLAKWRQEVNDIVLKPQQYSGRFSSAKAYTAVLGWVLSETEIMQLEAIRKKHGYWDYLCEIF